MSSRAARKAAAYRARRKSGVAVLKVAVDETAITEALVAVGALDRAESDNRNAVEAALSRMLGDWANAWWDLDL